MNIKCVFPTCKLNFFSCCSVHMQKILFLLSALFIAGCNNGNPLKSVFKERIPYRQYLQSLEKAKLDQTPMAQAWLSAGQRVFYDSVIVELPFTETGYFSAGEPEARSYRFEVKEGQVLTVEAEAISENKAQLFLDLFSWEGNEWEHQAHADSSLALNYEFKRNQVFLLRMQPELLTNMYYSIQISLTPVLVNPVSGATNRSIGSFYGADRDGGRRRHEGVDIFAPKGTPVIAPTTGQVSRVGTNTLGGKVVWMRDQQRGHSYYFAHLDSQLVQSGRRVQQGDTLGLVGNTGNARTTPPHLHFGIYQRGSKDPLSFIQTLDEVVKIPVDTSFLPQMLRVKAEKVNLRSGPGGNHQVIDQLERNHWLRVIGLHEDWFRIALPDKQQAFVHKDLVEPLDEVELWVIREPAPLLSEPAVNAVPITFLPDSSAVNILAYHKSFQYVKTTEGLVGWLEAHERGE